MTMLSSILYKGVYHSAAETTNRTYSSGLRREDPACLLNQLLRYGKTVDKDCVVRHDAVMLFDVRMSCLPNPPCSRKQYRRSDNGDTPVHPTYMLHGDRNVQWGDVHSDDYYAPDNADKIDSPTPTTKVEMWASW